MTAGSARARRTARASPANSELVAAVLADVRRLVRALRLSASETERRLGMSSAQLFVLHEIAKRPAPSLGELAARVVTDQSSVSVIVDRLVTAGLARRRRSSDDRRRWTVEITARGERVVSAAPEPIQARLRGALEALPPAKLASFDRALRAVLDQIGASPSAELFFENESAARRGSGARGAGSKA